MKRILAGLLLLAAGAMLPAQNLVLNLLAPLAPAVSGGEVRVDLVILNPTGNEAVYETPLRLEGRLTRGMRSWPVTLRGQAGGGALIAARGFSYRSFIFTVPKDAAGRLVLELDQPQPVRAVVDVHRPAGQTEEEEPAASTMVSAPLSNVLPNQPAATAIQRTFADRFRLHEPMYFIYGTKAPAVKFQFSFKYRLLGDASLLSNATPALRGVYLAFTQRSLWDIHGASSPFYDTSYMPEMIFESQNVVDPGSRAGWQWLGYQGALKHESNGKDGSFSRSLNIAYFRTAFALGRLDGWNVRVVPRVFTYVGDVANNRDISAYRGHAEIVATIGRNDGPSLSLTSRLAKKGALQADLSIPLKSDKLFDFATYFLIQYWDGYGESLLDYNKKSQTIRAGFQLVR